MEEILDHLEPHQLELFEDLLAQSAKGIHLIFDNPTIADALSKPLQEDDYFTTENMSLAQSLLTSFLERSNFYQKQMFLDSLTLEEKELLIRTYFHLVESTVQQSSEFTH